MNPYGLQSQPAYVSNPAAEREFITRVYGWMALALAITGLVAVSTASNPEFMVALMNRPILMLLVLAQLATVFVLSLAINKITSGVATGLFLFYAALTGLTFSTLFMVYTAASIGSVFFITAGMFGVVSAYGFVTKRDLTKVGNLALMGLIGLLIASVVNLFMRSDALYWVISYVGVVVFVALIAYDTQRIRRMANGFTMKDDTGELVEVKSKSAVLGALSLYLGFINLFLMLLRILGVRR